MNRERYILNRRMAGIRPFDIAKRLREPRSRVDGVLSLWKKRGYVFPALKNVADGIHSQVGVLIKEGKSHREISVILGAG